MDDGSVTPQGEQLVGQWVHAHEQDAGDVQAYVRADAPLPPSRGRMRWAFEADGTVRRSRPGPTDRPEVDEGTWRVTDGQLEVLLRDRSSLVYSVVDVGCERLTMSLAPTGEEQQ